MSALEEWQKMNIKRRIKKKYDPKEKTRKPGTPFKKRTVIV